MQSLPPFFGLDTTEIIILLLIVLILNAKALWAYFRTPKN